MFGIAKVTITNANSLSHIINTPDSAKQAIAAGFDKAARHYEKSAVVQAEIAQYGLNQFAKLIHQRVPVLVDLGCGTAKSYEQLNTHCDHYFGLDLSVNMLQQAHINKHSDNTVEGNNNYTFINADAENLPFHAATIDAFYSSMALQWCASPNALFSEVKRTLKPNGVAMLAIMVDGSFHNLHQAWQDLGITSRVNRFASATQWLDAANKFTWQVKGEVHTFTTQHDSVIAMLSSIKSVGANTKSTHLHENVPIAKQGVTKQGYIGKSEIKGLETRLRAYAVNTKRLALHYKILFITIKP